MIPLIEDRIEQLNDLCRRHGVLRLELFGSLATGESVPDSDLDLLVEFHPLPASSYADTYFGLLEALEELFEQPVDLVVESAIKNPYFRQSVEQTKVPLFA